MLVHGKRADLSQLESFRVVEVGAETVDADDGRAARWLQMMDRLHVADDIGYLVLVFTRKPEQKIPDDMYPRLAAPLQ